MDASTLSRNPMAPASTPISNSPIRGSGNVSTGMSPPELSYQGGGLSTTRGIADPASPPTTNLPALYASGTDPSTSSGGPYAAPSGMDSYPGGYYGLPPKVYGRLAPIEKIFDTLVAAVFSITRGIFSLTRSTTSWITYPFVNVTIYYATMARDVAMLYWNASATLRLFVYIFGIVTAIPLGIFATYAFISFSIVAGFTTLGVLLVEGLALGAGMLLLGPILLLSLAGALFMVTGYHLVMGGFNVWSGPSSTQSMWGGYQQQQQPTFGGMTGITGLLGSLFTPPSMPISGQYAGDQLTLKQTPSSFVTQPSVLTRP